MPPAEEKKDSPIRFHLTPLPDTARGFGTILNVHKKTGQLVYASGKEVVVRSVESPSTGYMYHGHNCKVNVAQMSPNGEWVASGDAEGAVKVWCTLPNVFGNIKSDNPCCASVLDVQWDGDGKRIAAVGKGGKGAFGRFFAWDSGTKVGDLDGHVKHALAVDFRRKRPFRATVVGEDFRNTFFKGPPFKLEATNKNHKGYPNLVRFSPNLEHYITVGTDHKIFMYEGKTGALVREIKNENGHKGNILSFAWSPDSKKIITVGMEKGKRALIWNLEDDSIETAFTFGDEEKEKAGESPGSQVSVVWHGDHIVTQSLNGQLNYLDPANPGQPKKVVQGSKSSIRDMSVHAGTGKAYTVDVDGYLTQYDIATGEGKWFTGEGPGKGVGVAASCDGAFVNVVGFKDKILYSDANALTFGEGVELGGAPTAIAAGNQDPALAVTVLAQDKAVVTKAGAVASTTELGYTPLCVAVSADDTKVAIGGKDKKVHVYDLAGDDLKECATYEGHLGHITAVTFTPDGRVTSAAKDKKIRVWSADGAKLCNLGYQAQTINYLAFNADGSRLASSSQDESVMVWNDMETFKMAKRDHCKGLHSGGVLRAFFSDDGTLVSCGSSDRSIKIRDI